MLKISNPSGDLAESIQLHQPQNQSQGYLLPDFFTKHTERHKPNPLLTDNNGKQNLKRDSGSKD